ncbi:MAG: hypothetical protein U1E23_18135 [Reyranellaceae bacterium]
MTTAELRERHESETAAPTTRQGEETTRRRHEGMSHHPTTSRLEREARRALYDRLDIRNCDPALQADEPVSPRPRGPVARALVGLGRTMMAAAVVPLFLSPSLLAWSPREYWQATAILYGVQVAMFAISALAILLAGGGTRDRIGVALPLWLVVPLPALLAPSLFRWSTMTYLAVCATWAGGVFAVAAARAVLGRRRGGRSAP